MKNSVKITWTDNSLVESEFDDVVVCFFKEGDNPRAWPDTPKALWLNPAHVKAISVTLIEE